MEIAAPSIADAIAKCAAAGATDVIIAPYFLSRCFTGGLAQHTG